MRQIIVINTLKVIEFKSSANFLRHATQTQKDKKKPSTFVEGKKTKSGGVLLSHTGTRAVPSALVDLTSEFEMRSGVTQPL